MPVKRRKDKKRITLAADAWDMMFQTGFDFFGQLTPLGIPDPLRIHPAEGDARADAEVEWDKATREAWARLGPEYMARWEAPRGHEESLPWAFETYGPPEEMDNSHAN